MNTPEIIIMLADKIIVTNGSILCRIPGMGWRDLPEVEVADEDRQQIQVS